MATQLPQIQSALASTQVDPQADDLAKSLHHAHPEVTKIASDLLAQMHGQEPEQTMADPTLNAAVHQPFEQQRAYVDQSVNTQPLNPATYDWSKPAPPSAAPVAPPASNMPDDPTVQGQPSQPQQPQLTTEGGIQQQMDRDAAVNAQHEQRANQILGSAEGQQLEGLTDKEQATEQYNKAIAPSLEAKTKIEEQSLGLMQKANDWIQQKGQEYRLNKAELRDRMMLENARDPTNLWGNATTTQKIAGILGIIGAGFAHQDATARIEHIVDQSVADSKRRMDNLKFLGQQEDDTNQANQQAFGTQINAANLEKANKLEIISKQMDQAANALANPIARANLKQEAAKVMAMSVMTHTKVDQTYGMERKQDIGNRLHLLQIQEQEKVGVLNALKPGRGAEQFQLQHAQRVIEGGAQAIKAPPGYQGQPYLPPGEATNQYRSASSAGKTINDAISDATSLIHQIHDAEGQGDAGRSAALRKEYKQLANQLVAPMRLYTKSGANITGVEEGPFKETIPSWFSAITGTGDLTHDEDGLKMIQYMIAKNLRNQMNQISPNTAQFDDKDATWGPALQWGDDLMKRGQGQGRIDQILEEARKAHEAEGKRSPSQEQKDATYD